MRIIVVEDDNIEADSLVNGLKEKLNADVSVIHTEREFVGTLGSIAEHPPDLIVLDVMLRWTDPTPDLKIEDIPADVLRDGFYSAGVRCVKRLEADNRTKGIPVVFYTTLERNEFGLPITHITKGEEIDSLAQAIRSKVQR